MGDFRSGINLMGVLQQVIASYGGGGGSPPVPSTLAQMWMWGEPSRETGLNDGDPMATLTDQLGGGRNWSQSTASFKPIYKTGILNGLACARGEGFHSSIANFWTGPSLAGLTAAHVFLIAKCDTEAVGTNDNGLWNFGTQGNNVFYPWTDNKIYDATMSSARKDNISHTGQALTSWRVLEVISTSSEWTMKLDGTQLFTTGTNTVSGNSAPRLMRNDSGDALKGYVAGVYIFSAKQTTDRATLITYINTRFGLSVS